MIHMSLNQAASLLKCAPLQRDINFTGITSDSRQVVPGMLFAALPGQTFDGHDYIQQAMERGAVAALVSRVVPTGLPVLQVTDVWQRLAPSPDTGVGNALRKSLVSPVATVKPPLKKWLPVSSGRKVQVLATGGNFNNELGLPLTVFQLNKSHDYAVLEMGASNPGDIAYLAGIAKPDVGVITNIGPAHLQGFINIQGVARAKGELFAALPRDGAAIINAAEPWVDLWQDINKAGNHLLF